MFQYIVQITNEDQSFVQNFVSITFRTTVLEMLTHDELIDEVQKLGKCRVRHSTPVTDDMWSMYAKVFRKPIWLNIKVYVKPLFRTLTKNELAEIEEMTKLELK